MAHGAHIPAGRAIAGCARSARRCRVRWLMRTRRGLTLIELIIAMAGTALVATAVAMTLFAVGQGSAEDADLRALVARRGALAARHNAALRCSCRVLARTSMAIVLWMGDADGDDAPDLSELRRLDFDVTSGELRSYRAPDDLDPADDVQYALADDFLSATARVMGSATFPATLWGTALAEWSTILNHLDPQQATLVSYRMTLRCGSHGDPLRGAAALRN